MSCYHELDDSFDVGGICPLEFHSRCRRHRLHSSHGYRGPTTGLLEAEVGSGDRGSNLANCLVLRDITNYELPLRVLEGVEDNGTVAARLRAQTFKNAAKAMTAKTIFVSGGVQAQECVAAS